MLTETPKVTLSTLPSVSEALAATGPRVAIMRSINSGPSRRDKDKDKGDGEGGGMRSSHDAQVLREQAERLLENTDLQRRIRTRTAEPSCSAW